MTLVPIRVSEDGARVKLQAIEFVVETPDSPLSVIAPARDGVEVYTRVYNLSVIVVPGSRVLIDGRDYTFSVDRLGRVTAPVEVFARGENVVSILVETPNHRQTRRDVTLYRGRQEVNLELAQNTSFTSSRKTATFSGMVDPEAEFAIETPHVEGSVKIDANGFFSFTAQLDKYGYNLVRMRASAEGREDSVISFQVKYNPSFPEYTNKAWRMGKAEYEELVKYNSIRVGQVYLCRGEAREVVRWDPTVFIMDVGAEGEPRYVAIENDSRLSPIAVGARYEAYSDVTGTYYYQNRNIPLLVTRFMEVPENSG